MRVSVAAGGGGGPQYSCMIWSRLSTMFLEFNAVHLGLSCAEYVLLHYVMNECLQLQAEHSDHDVGAGVRAAAIGVES